MNILFCALIGYCIGCINPAFIISKLKGFDIRERGTGNAGASNAMMTMGKKAGAFIAVFDILKAAAAVVIAVKLFPHLRLAKIISGCCCILGHIFPLPMRFHGGKGLACLGGVLLACSPVLFLILFPCEVIIALILDYICVIPLTGSVLLTVIYAVTQGDPIGTLIISLTATVMLFKHTENLKKIHNGTEPHISFMWKKDQEIERIRKNSEK